MQKYMFTVDCLSGRICSTQVHEKANRMSTGSKTKVRLSSPLFVSASQGSRLVTRIKEEESKLK